MKTKSHLSTKDLTKLRTSLPHGGIKTISEKTKLNHSTVSKVLKGVFFNESVIKEALKLIEESKRKTDSLKKRIDLL